MVWLRPDGGMIVRAKGMMSRMIHAEGFCIVCDNGDLVFSIRADSGDVIVECAECMTGYSLPLDLSTSPRLRMEEVGSKPATSEAILAAGLGDLVDS
jgi:hypothetical protein